MTTLFEDRERAAEYGFTHAEELRFLALRDATESLARWAAAELGETPEAGAGYAAALVGRLVGGAEENSLIAQVRHDLDVRGKPSGDAGRHFAQALAEASDRLHGRLPLRQESVVHPAGPPVPHTHGFWGWTV